MLYLFLACVRAFVFCCCQTCLGEGVGGEDAERDSLDDSLSTVTLLNYASVVYIG